MPEIRVFNGVDVTKLELLEYLYQLKQLKGYHASTPLPGWLHDIVGALEAALQEGHSPGDIITGLRRYRDGQLLSEGLGTDRL
jgi:hypothetical protein